MSIQVVTAVIEREDRRLLIGQRRRQDSSPLKWEFPGGKVKLGESLEQALARELREELEVTLLRAVPISRVEHEYGGSMGSLSIIFFAVPSRNRFCIRARLRKLPGFCRASLANTTSWPLTVG